MIETKLNPRDTINDWSVTKRFGIPLYINHCQPPVFMNGCVIDVEDDEKGNFVGIGIYGDTVMRGSDKACYYWSDWGLAKTLVIPQFIAHHGKTDLTKLKNWGFKVDDSYLLHDTIIASYVFDITRQSHSLKTWAEELGMPYPRYEDIVGKGRNRKTLDKQDVTLVAEYNACDCVATYKLWHYLKKAMTPSQMKYYHDIEMFITHITWRMQEQGIRVDLKQLHEFKLELEKQLQLVRDRLPMNFNVLSPKVTKELLKTNSASKKDLSLLNTPLAKDILEYKRFYKLLSTYIKPYLESNGELHPEFNQGGFENAIRTGRLSSSNPNFQNLPSHTEEGLKIRDTIIPKINNTFILADYSQIELRVLAHFCQDKRMIEAFNTNQDIHEATASAIGCSRDIAKTINFAIVYGSGAYNLSNQTGIPLVEATEFMDRFEQQFNAIYKWKERTLNNARQQGFITTLLGRQIKYSLPRNCKKHHLKSINKGAACGPECKFRLSGEADRRAISAIIQGSAAEIIKLAMLKLDEKGFKFPVQEHDALLFEEPDIDYLPTQEITHIMENVVKLSVPVKVDITCGDSWGACKR